MATTRRRYTSGADLVYMSEEDEKLLGKYGDEWQAASARGDQAGMQAAHDAAEALRAKYNYSGGADGSEYIKLDQQNHSTAASRPNRTEGIPEFTYETAPTYTSKYQDQIDELLGEILDRPDFSYDPETDPRYQAFRKEYQREGQRATADTMGQYAAMTGGMPSTAATVAAQQAGDYYAAQMADRIPELYQLAYSMYQDEGDNMRLNMDLLTALEQGDYNKYLNLLAQYNNDRAFAYGLYSDNWNRNYQLDRDDIADQRYDMEWNYGVGRDQLSDQRYEDETEYARALDRAQTLAAAGDFSGYRALGYSDAEISAMQSAYDREMAAVSRGSGSSGGSSGRPRLTYSQAMQAIEDGRVTDAVIEAYDYYMGDGAYEAAYGTGEEDEGYGLNDLNTVSVLELGIGPISFQTVDRLVNEGKVEVYTDGTGQLSVRWADGYNAENYKNDKDTGSSLPFTPRLPKLPIS